MDFRFCFVIPLVNIDESQRVFQIYINTCSYTHTCDKEVTNIFFRFFFIIALVSIDGYQTVLNSLFSIIMQDSHI
jgi:hypothetical protein